MRGAPSAVARGAKRLLATVRLGWLHSTGRCRIPHALFVLMYHAVTRRELRDPMQMSLPLGLLVRQLETLVAHGVSVLPLDEAIRRVWSSEALTAPIASVVFDDGYENTYAVALPALRELRIPATVFLAAKFIGGPHPFPFARPEYGNPLSWSQVAEMARLGVRFGAHGYSHIDLGGMSREAVVDEVRRSRAAIEDRIGVPVDLFAYPYGGYGSFNRVTRDVLMQERFLGACTTVWGRNRRADDRFRLKRVRLSWCDPPENVRTILLGCYDWYAGVQRIQGLLARPRAKGRVGAAPHGRSRAVA